MVKRAIIAILVCAAAWPAFGFALLGPYADWMTWSNSYRRPGQIGGPMDLGEEYRWNLPVITYGFDPEFVAYFGQNGVAAVERAFAFLTNLPPVSEIDLAEHGLRALLINQDAEELDLIDLTSFTLQWLLHQLGLAEPSRYMWTMGQRSNESFPVIERNFHPASLMPTNLVNETAYVYQVYTLEDGSVDAIEMIMDPLAIPAYAVADDDLQSGRFVVELTQDDVGGWRYLYSHSNVNIEPLPPGVTTVGTTQRPVPDIAPRPGIEKMTFLGMTWNTNAGRFDSLTNLFELTYVTNGITVTQNLQRIVTTPDILFQVRDLGGTRLRARTGEYAFVPLLSESIDATRWQNLSHLNGSTGAGPGLIPPGAHLTFNKLERYNGLGLFSKSWGSFDGTANPPVTFLNNERLHTITLDNYIQHEGTNSFFTSVLLGTIGAVYRIESSTNLIDWTPFTTITNDNYWSFGVFSFPDSVSTPKKFYRALRQE